MTTNEEKIIENAIKLMETALRNPFLSGCENKDFENDSRLITLGYIQGVISLTKKVWDICDVWTDEHL